MDTKENNIMPELSFQLYSARKFPPLQDVFATIAECGYRNVEGYAALFDDIEVLGKAMAEHGLSMPSCHISLVQLQDSERVVRIARELGISRLICPAIPHDQRSQPDADWVALAETLDGLCKTYMAQELRFGWHNHAFEFAETEKGRLPIDILMQGAPAMEWEMDVAWVVRGGEDPMTWMEKYADRITALHVKDLAPEGECRDEDGWADAGHGVLPWQDWAKRFAAETPVDLLVLEHDNPSDFQRMARRGMATMRNF